MNLKSTILAFATLFLWQAGQAQKTVSIYLESYKKRSFITFSSDTLPYRLLFPENYDKKKKYPLVLFLHGAGERGKDNELQLVHGASMFLTEKNRTKYPCIVLIPQCPTEGYWVNGDVDRSVNPHKFSIDYTQPSPWPLNAAISLTRGLMQEEAVDTNRIYIMGLSMGGMGTFQAVHQNPGLFAAAIPICGGGDTQQYNEAAKTTKFWVFHGDADSVVPVDDSRNMVKALKALDFSVKYKEYKGVDHNSWDSAFKEKKFLKWLFKQKK